MGFKVVCAWCKERMRGDSSATVVSHGICASCAAGVLAEVGLSVADVRFKAALEHEPSPWDQWVDIGGEA